MQQQAGPLSFHCALLDGIKEQLEKVHTRGDTKLEFSYETE